MALNGDVSLLPSYSRGLIRIFAGRILDSQRNKVSLSEQRRFRSEGAHAQTDLSFFVRTCQKEHVHVIQNIQNI